MNRINENQAKPETLYHFKSNAPGKVIVSGEHAVVYGAEAVAFAINKRTFAEFNLKNFDSVYTQNNFELDLMGVKQSYYFDKWNAVISEIPLFDIIFSLDLDILFMNIKEMKVNVEYKSR